MQLVEGGGRGRAGVRSDHSKRQPPCASVRVRPSLRSGELRPAPNLLHGESETRVPIQLQENATENAAQNAHKSQFWNGHLHKHLRIDTFLVLFTHEFGGILGGIYLAIELPSGPETGAPAHSPGQGNKESQGQRETNCVVNWSSNSNYRNTAGILWNFHQSSGSVPIFKFPMLINSDLDAGIRSGGILFICFAVLQYTELLKNPKSNQNYGL